jgi:integrase
LRVADGQGGASTVAVGRADDFDEADGTNYLTFWQAQEKAKHTARKGPNMALPLTIQVAAETYLSWLEAKNPRTAADTRGRLNKHFLPKFGAKLVTSLTKTILDGWLASMVISSPDAEKVRRSRDSANRVLTMVKALLNHAVRDVTNGIMDDSAWRHVRPFQGVAKPREVRFTQEEVSRLWACAPDKATRSLLTGAFLTGARYGELIEAKIAHFDVRSGTLKVNVSKTGARTIVLQSSASEFFIKLTKDREGDEYIFIREDGSRWKRSDQTRPIKEALNKAELPEEGSIYALRHTYISHAIEGGVPLNIIADNCGTSVRMIEKTYAKILAEKRREFIQIGAPSI